MFNIKNFIINNFILYKIYLKCILFFEPNTVLSKRNLARLINESPTIVEIGAHVGSDTVQMAVLWPKGRIYSFEPVKNIFDRLQFKTKNFKNIKIIQAAITDKNTNGVAEMYLSDNSDCSSSLLRPKDHLLYCPDVKFLEKTVSIKTLVLGEWLEENKIFEIDLMWVDVQGMELSIFESLGEKIKLFKYIYAEVSLKEFFEGCGSYGDIKEYLNKFGFVFVADDMLDGQLMGNALFKRNS
jgi:FkbM family methyltransferase